MNYLLGKSRVKGFSAQRRPVRSSIYMKLLPALDLATLHTPRARTHPLSVIVTDSAEEKPVDYSTGWFE